MTASKYSYCLDGTQIDTNDPILSGRQIRSNAGLVPASDHVLIEIGDRTSRSIGLEEQIELQKGEVIELRSFRSDRVFSLTINERGFEWGADSISAADIRRYAAIPDDQDLLFDSKDDRVIPDNGMVTLKPKGVERFRSAPAATVCIIVNTRQKQVERGEITFAELASLAFPDAPYGQNTAFTVSFRKGGGGQPDGTLVEGEKIRVVKGMVFNVSATDKS